VTRSQLQVIGAMAALPYPPDRTIVGDRREISDRVTWGEP
jgi:hypothetical protein